MLRVKGQFAGLIFTPSMYCWSMYDDCEYHSIFSLSPDISPILCFLTCTQLQKKATLPIVCIICEHGEIDGGLGMRLPICS